jgi:decaprenylphospho-beta-D-ribofuranose 2-oxidase
MHSLDPVSASAVLTGGSLALVSQRVEGWGMAVGGEARVFRPTDVEGVRAALSLARAEGSRIALRGSGCSYGDGACGTGKIVIDFRDMNRILAFDVQTGVIRVEAGATLRDVWQRSLPEGWWPPVVSGTMEPTLGGALGMNLHGKNAHRAGPIGKYVTSLKVMFASGEERDLTPDGDPDLFHAIVGGFGELAIILEVELHLKRVHSGQIEVLGLASTSLDELFAQFREHEADSDYLVGWIDGFAGGKSLGRGLIHVAWQLKEGVDPDPKTSTSLAAQQLPSRLFGVFPKKWMWAALWPFSFNFGMRMINSVKYLVGRVWEHGKKYRQSHAAFHFLLDYVPNWKWAYKPGGLIQHQSFVPYANAPEAFREILSHTQQCRMPTWLAVLKRHRPDPFLMTHGLDGYSMAMDFHVTKSNRARLWAMCHELDAIVVKHGGRFYFAKDATLEPKSVLAAFPRENLLKFTAFRKELDPDGVLATDLYDRLIAPALQLLDADPGPT